jgi:mannose-1-phosphate guanylyltransferase
MQFMMFKPKAQSSGPKTQHYAVILAGGAGERFWPLSRVKQPKYSMRLNSDTSMIQQTVARLKGLVAPHRIIIVTNKQQVPVIKKELGAKKPYTFLIEPCLRNTAAAIGLAAFYIRRKNPGALMYVLPADHYIRDTRQFQSTMRKAAAVAYKNYLVTIGVRPTTPHTGYGYIKTRPQLSKTKDGVSYYEIDRFVEKPDLRTAQMYVRNSRYFWNSGIFVWKVGTITENIKRYMPALYHSLAPLERLFTRPHFEKRLTPRYRRLKKISIDYGVMEKAATRAMVPAAFDWSDFGSWLSLEELYRRDRDGNRAQGTIVTYDTKDSILCGPDSHLIATCGVKDLVIVHTSDATLVVHKKKTQEVKQLLQRLRTKRLVTYL